MNYRDYKKFAPNQYYHIFNRGVAQQNIYLDKQDYEFFLYRFKENLFPQRFKHSPEDGHQGSRSHTPYIRKTLPADAFNIICYCLMPNHFHLVIKQNLLVPVSKLILKVCTAYSKYFNKKYGRVGSLFQDKFKAVLVANDSYLLWLSAYIHNNPRTGGLVENLNNWQWSSYLDYIGERSGNLCQKDIILNNFKTFYEYKDFITESYVKIKERKDISHLLLD